MATDHSEAERLHAYLDARVRGIPPTHDDLDPALVATYERVKALDEQVKTLDAQSAPDPQLMMNLWRTIVSTPIHAGQGSGAEAMRNSLPMPRPRWRGWDRMLTYQTVAVAMLLVAMLGSLAFGNRNGSDGDNHAGILPSPMENDGTHETAVDFENSARTGVSTESGPLTEPGVAWRTSLDDTSFMGLTLGQAADGTLVLLDSEAGLLQANSVATGDTLWQTNTGLNYPSEAFVIAGGLVIVSEGYSEVDVGRIAAFDLDSGAQVWINDASGTAPFSPAVNGDLLVYQSPDLTLRALELASGEAAWSVDLAAMSAEATGNGDPPEGIHGLQSNFVLAVDDGVAYLTLGDGVLYAIDLATQVLVWHHDFEATMLPSLAVLDGKVYLTVDRFNPDPTVDDPDGHGLVVRLDAAIGDRDWEISSPTYYWLKAVFPQVLVVNALLLDPESGEEIGSLPDGVTTPVFSGDAFYWSGTDGTMNAASIDSASGMVTPIWSVYIGVAMSERAPLLADGYLLSRGPDGTIMALGELSGTPVAETSDEGAVTDLSGLPPCVAPPPVDWQNVDGEPANTLETYTEQMVNGTPQPISPGYLYQPWFDYENVPEGTAADPDMIAGIRQTIADARVCARPGNEVDASGFYSEDFFRRSWVQERIAQLAEFERPMLEMFFDLVVDWLPPVESATVLEDGRVGVLLDPEPPMVDDFALYFVFVEQDGYWVVDEIIRVGPGALQG